MRKSLARFIAAPVVAFVALSCSAIPNYRLGDAAAPDSSSAAGDSSTCAKKPPGEYYRWFLSKGTRDGRLFGASGNVAVVDAVCQGAGEARWPGTRWRAYFWFDPNEHPADRLVEVCDGWFAEPDNAPRYRLFANKAALRDKPEGLPNVTEEGKRIESGALQVWTGGSAVLAGNRCANWSEIVNGAVGATGDPTTRERWMLDKDSRGCEAEGHLYCVEQPL